MLYARIRKAFRQPSLPGSFKWAFLSCDTAILNCSYITAKCVKIRTVLPMAYE